MTIIRHRDTKEKLYMCYIVSSFVVTGLGYRILYHKIYMYIYIPIHMCVCLIYDEPESIGYTVKCT